jgi:hypothetical protein
MRNISVRKSADWEVKAGSHSRSQSQMLTVDYIGTTRHKCTNGNLLQFKKLIRMRKEGGCRVSLFSQFQNPCSHDNPRFGITYTEFRIESIFLRFSLSNSGYSPVLTGSGNHYFPYVTHLVPASNGRTLQKYARTQAGNDVHKYIDPLTLNDPCFFMFCSGTGDSIRETVRGSKYV